MRDEILWDEWGVPHVFGLNHAGLFRSFGWAQMHSHGNLILRLYGQARGRAAEYWGDSYLASDRLVRTMGIPARARAWYDLQTPSFRPLLDSFAEGMNAYAAKHPEAIADDAKPALPIEPADAIAHVMRALFVFLTIRGQGRQRIITEGLPGSNGWAIGPSAAKHGHSILLANPHLPWSDLYLFYEAHLVGPDVDAYGATLIGWPVLAIAFNENLGWTHTVNAIDPWDSYALKLAGDGYEWDGGIREFEVETQSLRVRGEDRSLRTEPLVIRRSVHGPVIGDIEGQPISVRVVGVDQAPVPGLFEQYWDMMRARDLQEFENVLARLQIPMFTLIYADREGHIMHLFNGLVPVRPRGDSVDWAGVLPGNSSGWLWHETHSYADLPRVLDPESGWLQNGNCPPWTTTLPSPLDPERFPPYMAPPPQMSFREQRAARMIQGHLPLTLEDVVACQSSTGSELAERVLDDLLVVARGHDHPLVARALDVLAAWDRKFDSRSRGAVLFSWWVEAMRPSDSLASNIFETPWSQDEPLTTPRGLVDPEAAIAALLQAAERLEAAVGAMDVPLGSLWRVRKGQVDLPGCSGPGDPLGVLGNAFYAPTSDGPFVAVHGDTFIAVVEYGKPLRAQVLMTYGNSSQPTSPHNGDQLALYARRELRPAWRSREEVEAHLESRDVFEDSEAADPQDLSGRKQ